MSPPPPLTSTPTENSAGRVKRRAAAATNSRIKECAEHEMDSNESDGDTFILDEEEEEEEDDEENDGYETGGSFTSKNSETVESEDDDGKMAQHYNKLSPSICSESCTDTSDSESDFNEGVTKEDNLCDYKNEPFPAASNWKKKNQKGQKKVAACSTVETSASKKSKKKQNEHDRTGMESLVGGRNFEF